jgi:hypothetical protein
MCIMIDHFLSTREDPSSCPLYGVSKRLFINVMPSCDVRKGKK